MNFIAKLVISIAILLGTSLQAKTATLEQKISGLYIAFFNRAADKGGMDYWVSKANTAVSNGGSESDALKELSSGFAGHPTFISTYAGMTDEEFVEAIYRNSLGKDGDAEGVAYWTSVVEKSSRSDMVSNFIESSLETGLTTANFPTLSQADLDAAKDRQDLITNKADVAVYFTSTLTTATNVTATTDVENDPAYLASIQVLADVTTDSATVTTANAKVNGIKDDEDAIDSINSAWASLEKIIVSNSDNLDIYTLLAGKTFYSAFNGDKGSLKEISFSHSMNNYYYNELNPVPSLGISYGSINLVRDIKKDTFIE